MRGSEDFETLKEVKKERNAQLFEGMVKAGVVHGCHNSSLSFAGNLFYGDNEIIGLKGKNERFITYRK